MSMCTDCGRGKYSQLAAQVSEDACVTCGPGRHSAELGAQRESACIHCESGYYAPDSADRWEPCVSCEPGRFQPNRGSFLPCKFCGPGTYNPSLNASRCTGCLPGRYQSQSGQTNCKHCSPGMSMPDDASPGPCEECLPGRYSNSWGLSMCLSCAPGKYINSGGAKECRMCSYNTFASKEIEATACLPCPRGRTKRRTRTIQCDLCPPGRHWGTSTSLGDANRTCDSCSAGMYSPTSDSKRCRVCPKGTYSAQPEAERCLCCGAGKFSNKTNATSCTECPAGYVRAPSEAQRISFCGPSATSCQACAAGFYAPKNGMGACISCIAGKFSDQTGRMKCTDCPAGWISRLPESKKCEPKLNGTIVIPGGAATVAVPEGSRIDPMASSGFVACAAGTYGSDPPSGICVSCPAGYSSFRGSTLCNPCSKGRYGSLSECVECPAGFYQPQSTEPTHTCTACPVGWKQNSTGESMCTRHGQTPDTCGDALYLDMSKIDGPEQWLCRPCPDGGHCVGPVFWENATHHNLRPLFGWWEIPYHERDPSAGVKDLFAECVFEPACLGAYNKDLRALQGEAMTVAGLTPSTQNFTVSCNPALGFRRPSRLCQACADGFSRVGVTECFDCGNPASGRAIGLVIAGSALFLVVYAGLIWLRVRSFQRFNRIRRKKAAHSTLKRVLLSHLQMLLLVLGLAVQWPQPLPEVVRLVSSVAAMSPENTQSIECVFLESVQNHAEFYYGILLTAAVAPLAMTVLLAAYWMVFARGCRALSCGIRLRKSALEAEVSLARSAEAAPPASRRQTLTFLYVPSTADVFVTSCVLLWYMILPSLLRIGTAVFRCRYVGQPSQSKSAYLVLDLEETCWEGPHLFFTLGVAVPMLILYGAVVPAAITAVLYREGDARLTNPSFMLRWGLVHSGYRKERFYWEMVVLLRKYCIIAVSTFEHRDMHQLHMVLAVLILALHFHDSQQPFGRDSELAGRLHRFEMWSLMALLFVVWSGVYFSLDAFDRSGSCEEHSSVCWLFVVAILGSNVVYLVVLSGSCCTEFGKRNRIQEHIKKRILSLNSRNHRASGTGTNSGIAMQATTTKDGAHISFAALKPTTTTDVEGMEGITVVRNPMTMVVRHASQ